MKKLIALLLAVACAFSFIACSKTKQITIAIPNDATNEGRALLLMEELGYIELDDAAGITASINDITSNPYNIKFQEVEAAQLPSVLKDVDYAIINSNYALNAGLNPVKDGLACEDANSPYANILCVKEGNENADWAKALKAALESQQVKDYISTKYDGSVVATVENPTDGYDATVDYENLSKKTIKIVATPTPHAEILNDVVKGILSAKGVTLDVIEVNDYVTPNNSVDSGDADANYFQHLPYMNEFNTENGTKVVSISAIHVEPLAIYGGKQTSLSAIKENSSK